MAKHSGPAMRRVNWSTVASLLVLFVRRLLGLDLVNYLLQTELERRDAADRRAELLRSPEAQALLSALAPLVALVAGFLVLYPVVYLLQAALNTGDPEARPPTEYGLDNFAGLLAYPQIILNTLTVSLAATVMALILGFVMAWIITRTNVPGRRFFEQMMVVPYYLTPLLGALAWSLLGTPESGFLNQVFRALGGKEYLININSPYGIAWVMALFEGSVAFVMIGAVMKSMDPALEEASQVMGASRLRTMLRITLPLGDR